MTDKPKMFPKGYLIPFILVTSLFMFWGIPNNLNDVLIRQFIKSFEINRLQAGLVQSAFYMGYFLLAIPAASFMHKYSYKTGLIFGMILYSFGSILFWPSAIMGQYVYFLGSLFVIASGLAFLELGANAFIAELGDPRTSERRLNFSQAFNPIGSIIGVLVGTVFIFSGHEPTPEKIQVMKAAGEYEGFLRSETMRVVAPYLVLGGIVFLWALMMMRIKFPEITDEKAEETTGKMSYSDLLKYPHFLKGVIAQFFYNGAQVGTWSFFISYIKDYTGHGEKIGGYLLTGTLIAFAVGRFTSTYLMKFIEPRKLMGVFGLVNITLVSICVIFPGWVGVWAIFATSFFMSLMYPTIFALSIKQLGPRTKIGGSVLVMAIVGGAVFTPVMGWIAQSFSMTAAMVVPLVCYIVISYFAFVGAKIKQKIFV
jgi:FHS family L-fucose permease-like MFS transporter